MTEWTPKTKLGIMVAKNEIESIHQVFETGYTIREPEIVDILIPRMIDQVIDINMVQRMTDSGRRTNFAVTIVIGNGDGIVGVGRGKAKETGVAIFKAIKAAKLNIIELKRGCGSWQCGCGESHTLPYKVVGRNGSVEVTLKPAPKGVGLAVNDVARPILHLAGISDVWGFSRGHTKTTVNYALAVFDALKKTSLMKVNESLEHNLKITTGIIGVITLRDDETKENKNKKRR
ncbi:MAG: 30S ribosomal protein S5 [Candidatus Thermoplasmatota archaeon]|jgi:small subunit ribosomal protein S5|nr:30S ribosomal protein S5 [Candidatus Thermoplasmatota archaeon]MCL5962987.1 30S ribosomal protein S5 [Candidatus Thermoplasmatota archaeon]